MFSILESFVVRTTTTTVPAPVYKNSTIANSSTTINCLMDSDSTCSIGSVLGTDNKSNYSPITTYDSKNTNFKVKKNNAAYSSHVTQVNYCASVCQKDPTNCIAFDSTYNTDNKKPANSTYSCTYYQKAPESTKASDTTSTQQPDLDSPPPEQE
jgi:hypothetical protein